MGGELANPWWAYVILGVCGGLISGTLGLGSGTIFVPVLVLILLFPQKSAQGTALAVMVPMALVGALRYWANPQIEVKLPVVGLIVIGAVVGAFVGTELAYRLPGHVLKKFFAVYLLVVAVKMLLSSGGAKLPVTEPGPQPQQEITSVEKGVAKDEPGK